MTAKHIGIVACSSEGAALCYRTICLEAEPVMGEHCHPQVSMHTHPLADYMEFVRKADWPGVATLVLSSAEKLASAGADFLICPDNTLHSAFPEILARSPLPWLHIASEVATTAQSLGYRRLAVLGTRSLMEAPVYPHALAQLQIEAVTPTREERAAIDDIIFKELVKARFTTGSCQRVAQIIVRLAREERCDAVVLGCTELPLLIAPEHSALPILDSTRLLARAALSTALASR
jgi:aspartate racemase